MAVTFSYRYSKQSKKNPFETPTCTEIALD